MPERCSRERRALLLLSLLAACPLAGAAERPNIIFFYADDLARWAVGAYGNREVRTPNVDLLAREGARFVNAFVITPVCSPSRASLFTGRYPTELGIEDWINPGNEPQVGLDPDVPTWPKLLHEAGYRTGLSGKWHLGTAPRFHPTRNGFDHFLGFLGGAAAPMNPTLEVDGQQERIEGATSQVLADDAIRFLRGARDLRERGGCPFYLAVHFRAPHAPFAPVPPEDSRPYEGLDPTIPKVDGLRVDEVKRLTREYYASITCMDRAIGRVLAALDELGLAAGTLVVFTSDHGYMIGHHGLLHKGNGGWIVEGKEGPRPNMFDDSIRVPLVVRWPGVTKPGSRVEEIVTSLDVFPSMLEAAGVPLPASYRDRGRSFVPLLHGERRLVTFEDQSDVFLGQYDMHHYRRARMRMLRTPLWKLVRHYDEPGADELYDLTTDPGELTNLLGGQQLLGTTNSLQGDLELRMEEAGDPLAAGSGKPWSRR